MPSHYFEIKYKLANWITYTELPIDRHDFVFKEKCIEWTKVDTDFEITWYGSIYIGSVKRLSVNLWQTISLMNVCAYKAQWFKYIWSRQDP